MFGKKLKELRCKNNISQEELAKILGVSKSAIGMYELGKRMPHNKLLKKIANYFSVSIDYLLGFGVEDEKLRKKYYPIVNLIANELVVTPATLINAGIFNVIEHIQNATPINLEEISKHLNQSNNLTAEAFEGFENLTNEEQDILIGIIRAFIKSKQEKDF